MVEATDEALIGGILGDYREFFRRQVTRLERLGIDVNPCRVGHLAYRTESTRAYLQLRDRIEAVSAANVENEWNGRPISKLLLTKALDLGPRHSVDLIELIPPGKADPGRRTGIEHVGFVVGEAFDQFTEDYRPTFSGQQDQGPFNQPVFISFDDGTMVKFHRYSLHDVVMLEGRRFDGFHHSHSERPR